MRLSEPFIFNLIVLEESPQVLSNLIQAYNPILKVTPIRCGARKQLRSGAFVQAKQNRSMRSDSPSLEQRLNK